MAKGLKIKMPSSAAAREAGASASRPRSGAAEPRDTIPHARTTEGEPPAASAYPSRAGQTRRAVRRRPRRTSAPRMRAKNPQWSPDTAVMCMRPDSARSVSLCWSSPSRSPVRREVMSPAARGG